MAALRPASILGSHVGDRLSYGFLELLRCLVAKRSAESLENLKVLLSLCVQLSQPLYVIGRNAPRPLREPSPPHTTTHPIRRRLLANHLIPLLLLSHFSPLSPLPFSLRSC